MELQVNHVITWMEKSNEKIQTNKDFLSALDRAIGDGDHGINMARGFNEVVTKIKATDYSTVSDVLKDVSMTLLSKVGGASGPLYGTAFLKMSTSLKGREKIDYSLFVNAVSEALNGIKMRGKASTGEKTLVDVWEPIVEQLQKDSDFEAVTIETTAKNAMEATKAIEAKKGRAAYLGERSVGHLDPGSVSSYYIFSALSDVIKEGV
ncbi:dihydroxyacetone kinase subunit DhaL [Ornithinibacillus bavariensis]|uniref:dihydroxyacetone kinase subunit DhaL n=1 Tax=Ornithinibacillus bavariensis TaxID=545502 RepID=UPI000EC76CF8|nr:dihydroxyacetone kinase subunit L [Ornithinibacillus sp.]